MNKFTIWRNKKTGELYRIYDKAIDCTNERDGINVIIYGLKSNDNQTFVREESEFYEKFEEVPYKSGVMDGYRWDDAQRAMLCL
jgi:hypothetical protein